MPVIKTTFQPAWWLSNSHLQTLYAPLCRKPPQLHRKRERLVTLDGDFLDLDWYGEGSEPLIILLHGLTGSSQSGYILGLQHSLLKQGMRSVALNFRGCSGTPNQRARCYHSGETEDFNFVYQTLRQREPVTPIGAVGFSLGGNVLLKWLGEQSINTLFAAVAVSVPLVLNLCATRLDNGLSKLYRANLLRELKDYIHTKRLHLEALGETQEADKIKQLGNLVNVNSFWQYDDLVVAKLHGFKDVHDYYRRSSSRQFLKVISLPTLIIQSTDDPFMTPEVLPNPEELSSYVELEITEGGGHVGFISGATPFRPVYWLDQRIPAFLKQYFLSE